MIFDSNCLWRSLTSWHIQSIPASPNASCWYISSLTHLPLFLFFLMRTFFCKDLIWREIKNRFWSFGWINLLAKCMFVLTIALCQGLKYNEDEAYYVPSIKRKQGKEAEVNLAEKLKPHSSPQLHHTPIPKSCLVSRREPGEVLPNVVTVLFGSKIPVLLLRMIVYVFR